LNRPLDSQPGTKKALDSPRNSGKFGDFPKDGGGPKTAGNGPNNPEKSDPVRSVKCGTKRPKSSWADAEVYARKSTQIPALTACTSAWPVSAAGYSAP